METFPRPNWLPEEARPAKSGKRYKTRHHADATVEYLHRFGVQSHRYQWP